ncbi:MAG: hypothetical protein ACK4NC_05930 [Candidatus Gracilibacteria bacterium]
MASTSQKSYTQKCNKYVYKRDIDLAIINKPKGEFLIIGRDLLKNLLWLTGGAVGTLNLPTIWNNILKPVLISISSYFF